MSDTLAKIALTTMILVGIIAVVVVTFYILAPRPAASQPFDVALDEWGAYFTNDGVMSIKMPKAPLRETHPAPDSPTSEIYVLYHPQRVDQFAFSLRYSVIPEDQKAPLDDQIQSIRETFPMHMEGAMGKPVKVARERRLQQDGEKGIELALECGAEVTFLRVFIISGKMYTAALTAPLEKQHHPWISQFFDSLTISKH